MSFLNRVLASVGIGAASVEARVDNAEIRAGEELRGVVYARGGSVEQRVDGIFMYLVISYVRQVNRRRVGDTESLAQIPVANQFVLGPGEVREFPFVISVPDETPVSFGLPSVWLETKMEVPLAVDPKHNEYLEVLPHRNAQLVLEALDQLGFQLDHVECEYSRRHQSIVQELEFYPTDQFCDLLSDLEVILKPHADGVDAFLEIGHRSDGFVGLLEKAWDLYETRLRVEFRREQLAGGVDQVAAYLREILEKHSK